MKRLTMCLLCAGLFGCGGNAPAEKLPTISERPKMQLEGGSGNKAGLPPTEKVVK